jgi:thiol peroxidase
MANVTLHGNPSNTIGNLPEVGTKTPNFSLTASDLSDKSLSDYGSSKKVLNIVPSLDTSVCAASTRRFNQEAGSMKNTKILVISADLPFAQSRFCEVEGLKNVEALSTFRSSFPTDYGLEIAEGPLKGVCSRCVVVLDEDNKVIYTEQVPEITQEPDYEAALKVLQ